MQAHHSTDAGEQRAERDFAGAKLILLIGPHLLVIRRDNDPAIPWPGRLDFPGGGREGAETPLDCALRETEEEIGLRLGPDEVAWNMWAERPQGPIWYFAARIPAGRADDIVFGDEGQGWFLMPPHAYRDHPSAIPHFADRLQDFLDSAA